ncbi:hypothetical protein [Wenzhouxiangella marina]|uniref:Uncharacterized protein n=1 Tax=Wenzhouxiangella marina TaxID=1579979 RepID=A0A0K0XUH0_9GAMM|nr:hypothetical protein [Wenzhouxiangella marina]AKS41310.1 hypothetical protein WM2015_929 [Wenzhouxiangella marina]MBB6086940.1 hypothetical protein [Wenzhouxiangella marina]
MSETRCAGTFLGLLLAVALLGSTNLSAQVHRSATGIGDALILPYWTAAGGNDSLLSIRNDSERASAIKLLWLDEQGGVARSANLYLNARSIWTGAATDEMNPRMVHPLQANACLLPLVLNEETEYSANVREFSLGATRGSMEIIEMASIALDSPLAPEGRWIDCEALAQRWSDGAWSVDAAEGLLPPAGSLSANNNLINVALGGMNTIEATALGGFSDVVQHTLPEVLTPDLSQAVDSDAPGGGVRSAVCEGGHCRVDEWSRPVEAVAAALVTSAVISDYSVAPGLGADFDWLLHRPLDRYQDSVEGFSIGSSPWVSFHTRGGDRYVYCPPQVGCIPGSPPGTDETPFDSDEFLLELDAALHVLSMSREVFGGEPISPILGHPVELNATPFPSLSEFEGNAFDEGIVRLRFDGQDTPLVAPGGRAYVGEPVIAVGFQQFTNGGLPGGTLANYRGTEAPRYEVTIIEPQE